MKIQTRRGRTWCIVSFLLFVMIVLILLQIFSPPRLKEQVFEFRQGEKIPHNSDAYFKYGSFYADEDFDEQLFSMVDIGSYEVDVTYTNRLFTLQIEIVDTQAPMISFVQAEPIIVYRTNGDIHPESIFIIEDESPYTYKLTPDANALEDGTQEICVYAEDEVKNQAFLCEEVTLQIIDLENASKAQESSITTVIQTFMQEYSLNEQNFGFFYDSPMSNESYIFNESAPFLAASTIKVPLNMLYYDKIKDDKLSLANTFPLYQTDIEEGNGYTAIQYRIGEQIPLSFLLQQSIVYSDNTASNILIRELGGLYKFREQLMMNVNFELPSNFATENIVTMRYMMEVMKYLYQHSNRYEALLTDMKNASHGSYLDQHNDTFEIAQKYGFYDTYYHATGIVYTPHPYVIGIYTNHRLDASQLMKELTKRVTEYQLSKL